MKPKNAKAEKIGKLKRALNKIVKDQIFAQTYGAPYNMEELGEYMKKRVALEKEIALEKGQRPARMITDDYLACLPQQPTPQPTPSERAAMADFITRKINTLTGSFTEVPTGTYEGKINFARLTGYYCQLARLEAEDYLLHPDPLPEDTVEVPVVVAPAPEPVAVDPGPQAAPESFIGVQEVREMFNLSTATVYEWIRRKKVAFVRQGRRVMFDYKEIEDFYQLNYAQGRPEINEFN